MIRAALFAVLCAGPALAAEPTARVDRQGVRWSYGERVDPITDRLELLLVATWRSSHLGLLCVQGEGMRMSIVIPRWYFLGAFDRPIRARIGRDEPFDVQVFGDSSDGRRGTVRPSEAGRNLARGLLEGQERLTIQNQFGESVIVPLASPRPALVAAWRNRCREITSPATER